MAKHGKIKLDKSLGQHFLNDQYVLQKITDTVNSKIGEEECIIEVGPGAGALTAFFYKRVNYSLVEFDERWSDFLKNKYPNLKDHIYNVDFLKMDLHTIYNGQMAIVGNFPYNISSQIMFKVLDFKESIPVVIGMFQKEVAIRICSGPNSKSYGILSVLLQVYYNAEYLFDVPKEAFNPPPKVTSGVMSLTRKPNLRINHNEKFFKQVVKLAFGQRRKTLRNSLKALIKNDEVKNLEIFNKRPESLSVDAFINLTNILEA